MSDRVTDLVGPRPVRVGTYRILQSEWPEKAARVAEGIKQGRYALVEPMGAD